MKNLTIITDAWAPQINGVVTTMQQVVKGAEERQWNITVIHPGMFKTCSLPGYKEIKIAINPWKLLKLIPRHTDSIHIVTEGPIGWAARILCAIRGWSYTSGFHTNFPEYLSVTYNVPKCLTYPIFKWFHKKSEAVFVPSKSTADKLSKLSFKNLVVWGRGYDPKVFNIHRKRADLLTPNKINLVYVGRVSKEKNIEAFLSLNSPEYSLWVVGDGPDRKRLEALNLATFVGFKTGVELAEYFASADVFVFPSKTDTLGIVSIEAMACGTPVAAFNVEGPRDVIIQGKGGFVNDDLKIAVHKALELRGNKSVLGNAQLNTWSKTTDIFLQNIVDLKGNKF